MSRANSPPGSNPGQPPRSNSNSAKSMVEKGLAKMEALLQTSALGVHVLFDNHAIAKTLSKSHDDRDFLDVAKMKRVQDLMTDLVAKSNYYDKVAYLEALDEPSLEMLIRAYFHIVENTVRSNSEHPH